MCGIVGYIGSHEAAPIVLEGLKQSEYRGYDSAGMVVVDDTGTLQIRRAVGKLTNLEQLVLSKPVAGRVAIGHTRWATHGPPCQHNSHPHASPDGKMVVVQNGIVENFLDLRQKLQEDGYVFRSDTDTEVIVHLIHHNYHNGSQKNVILAMRRTLTMLKGPSAIVLYNQEEPDQLIVARLGNAGGVTIGYGHDEMFIASDIPAILQHTNQVAFLESRQMAIVSSTSVDYLDLDGKLLEKKIVDIDWDPISVEKGIYHHYMQKEIFEQGQSLTDTLRGRLNFEKQTVQLDTLNLSDNQLSQIEKVTILACGTSYYAGLVAKFYIEQLARIPVEVDYASEFRYRNPLVKPEHLVVAITQSGETVDTLAALEEAQASDAMTVAVVNTVGSQATRLCDGLIYMQAGPEIGVASTKAYTASLVVLLLLAMYLGQENGSLAIGTRTQLIQALAELSGQAGNLLDTAWQTDLYKKLAEKLCVYHNFLYLGRGINYPVALEGALKLKEISYIHAEGYPAGEMKHGPIALIDEQMPTVVIAPKDSVYSKMISQIEQVKARGGLVLAIAHDNDDYIHNNVDFVLPIPDTHPLLTPILAVIPLQILAYEIANLRGEDIDQPRNLAKSVTVE